MSDIKELKDEELEQVAGGGYHGEIIDYITDPPENYVFTIEGHRIDIGLVVLRLSDNKWFRCVGYENNNDNTTTWVFKNDSGTEENIIYCAYIHNETINEFGFY